MVEALGSPVYEVKQDSQWYKDEKQRRKDTKLFFKRIQARFGMNDGFAFYHSNYFGIHAGTDDFEKFKGELLKNPSEKDDFHPFRKRSKYYKELQEMLSEIKEVYPFKPHDELGLNNVKSSHWIKDRWFYQVRNKAHVKSEGDVMPVDYNEYLKLVMGVWEEQKDQEKENE